VPETTAAPCPLALVAISSRDTALFVVVVKADFRPPTYMKKQNGVDWRNHDASGGAQIDECHQE